MQVDCVRTTNEALALLETTPSGQEPAYDVILKEHEPPQANACRLLRRMAESGLLARIPVVCECTTRHTRQKQKPRIVVALTLGDSNVSRFCTFLAPSIPNRTSDLTTARSDPLQW